MADAEADAPPPLPDEGAAEEGGAENAGETSAVEAGAGAAADAAPGGDGQEGAYPDASDAADEPAKPPAAAGQAAEPGDAGPPVEAGGEGGEGAEPAEPAEPADGGGGLPPPPSDEAAAPSDEAAEAESAAGAAAAAAQDPGLGGDAARPEGDAAPAAAEAGLSPAYGDGGAIEGEGMFPNDSVLSEIAHQPQGDNGDDYHSPLDVEAPTKVTAALEKQLNEALARCRLVEDDRDQLERQVRELRLKADLEAQARQQAEVAREAAEEELRYRMTVQDKTDSQAHSRIAALEAMVRELQGQLEDIEEQEGVVSDLKDRVQRAERQVNDKDAHFDRIQSDLERRLAQQQQLITKNRQYMEAVGRRKLLASNTLNNALMEMRSKHQESDQSVETLEMIIKRLDSFMTEESERLKEVADMKQSISTLRGKGAPNIEALEQLEIKLRQERDGAQADFNAQRRLEDELLSHVFPRGPAPVAPGPYAPPHFGHDMGGGGGGGGMWGGGHGDGGYGGMHGAYDVGQMGQMAHKGFGGMGMPGAYGAGFDPNMGHAGMPPNWGMMGPGMGGQMGPGWGGGGGGGGGVWPMAMPHRPEGGVNMDGGFGGGMGGAGGGAGGGYLGGNNLSHNHHSSVHDSVASYAPQDVSHHSHYSQDNYEGSPPKAAPPRASSAGQKLPPVPSAAAKGAGKPADAPPGRGPRERRLKEAAGGGGAPVPPGRGAKGEGGGKKDDLKNARQKELAAKAAERRGNR
jgi:hypothetical protein